MRAVDYKQQRYHAEGRKLKRRNFHRTEVKRLGCQTSHLKMEIAEEERRVRRKFI
jgi:hypothetical protein